MSKTARYRLECVRFVSRFIAVLAVAGFAVGGAHSESLGVHGRTYRIAEPDMIEVLKARMQKKIDSGEYDRYREQARERTRAAVLDPKPGPWTPLPAQRSATRYFDPTYTVPEDVRLPDGRVVVRAGTTINPLDHVPFTATWLFIDGREPKQLAWAEKQLAEPGVMPIFVAGKWVDAWRTWQRRTWFDQGDILTRRMGITATPAIVRQEGRRIRIDEIELR